MNRINGVVDV